MLSNAFEFDLEIFIFPFFSAKGKMGEKKKFSLMGTHYGYTELPRCPKAVLLATKASMKKSCCLVGMRLIMSSAC